ncbi:MAG: hypothetical protein M3Y41_21455 [Pseudomonadota bacterium]|nr:hypothetical protein [Pseudomonadota bacterium]
MTEPVSLISSSDGGPAALRFAIDFPQRTDKLVIQAFAPALGRSPPRAIAELTTAAEPAE